MRRLKITCHFTGVSLRRLSGDLKNQLEARFPIESDVLVMKDQQPCSSIVPEQRSPLRNIVPTIV